MKGIIALIVSCMLCAQAVQQIMNCTGPNEQLVPCKNNCTRDTCDAVMTPITCINFLPCSSGCMCLPGFFRKNETADCMPITNCFT